MCSSSSTLASSVAQPCYVSLCCCFPIFDVHIQLFQHKARHEDSLRMTVGASLIYGLVSSAVRALSCLLYSANVCDSTSGLLRLVAVAVAFRVPVCAVKLFNVKVFYVHIFVTVVN